MAILCRELGLLFIQTPHTGSTAIGRLLRSRFAGERIPEEHARDSRGNIVAPFKHATLPQLLKAGLITPAQRRGLLVAAGVRNPYDMMVTEFIRTTQGQVPATSERDGRLVARRRPNQPPPPTEFGPWLRWRFAPTTADRLRLRRHHALVDHAAGVDEVIRFERIQDDFDAVMRRLGVTEPTELEHVNPTVARQDADFTGYYDAESRRIIEDVFGEWLRRFGYRLDAPAEPQNA